MEGKRLQLVFWVRDFVFASIGGNIRGAGGKFRVLVAAEGDAGASASPRSKPKLPKVGDGPITRSRVTVLGHCLVSWMEQGYAKEGPVGHVAWAVQRVKICSLSSGGHHIIAPELSPDPLNALPSPTPGAHQTCLALASRITGGVSVLPASLVKTPDRSGEDAVGDAGRLGVMTPKYRVQACHDNVMKPPASGEQCQGALHDTRAPDTGDWGATMPRPGTTSCQRCIRFEELHAPIHSCVSLFFCWLQEGSMGYPSPIGAMAQLPLHGPPTSAQRKLPTKVDTTDKVPASSVVSTPLGLIF